MNVFRLVRENGDINKINVPTEDVKSVLKVFGFSFAIIKMKNVRNRNYYIAVETTTGLATCQGELSLKRCKEKTLEILVEKGEELIRNLIAANSSAS